MFNKEVYIERRRELRSKLKSGVIILPSGSESPMNYPANTYHYRADSSYLYYFGISQPDFVGVIDIDEDHTCLYGNDVTIDDIIWMGQLPTVREQATHVGVSSTYSLRELTGFIKTAISQGRRIHFLPQHRADTKIMLEGLLGISIASQDQYVSEDLIRAIVSMREIKSKIELEEIDRACDTACLMYYKAMELCKAGVTEREIAGQMEGIALSRGAGYSFPYIVSQNGETLHNHDHSGTLEDGRLLLIDSGAETVMNYCSDFTRTLPVSGKFTETQRVCYDIVVDSVDTALSMIRPGVAWSSVHLEACRKLVVGLTEMGIMKGDSYEAVASGAHALFMPCGLGHQMGMDVHDMEGLGENYVGYDDMHERSSQFGLCNLRMGKKLKEGHVMTVEPGIYFIPALIDKWEEEHIGSSFVNYEAARAMVGFGGIRIELDIVVTADGYRELGNKHLPYKADDIERLMSK